MTSLLVGCYLSLLSMTTYAEDWVYTIKAGDTIWQLTSDKLIDRHAWKAMLDKNGIKVPEKLMPGTKLYFPMELVKKYDSSARVINVHGHAQLLMGNSSKTVPLKPGMRLSSGDRVTTDSVGTILLLLADNSQVIIKANSDIYLRHIDLLGDANSRTLNFDAKLKYGEIEVNANPEKHLDDSRYLIETPIANTAVRGTEFYVQSDPKMSRMGVYVGRVDVANGSGHVSIPQGYATLVEQGKAPIEPVALLKPPQIELADIIHYLPHRISLPMNTSNAEQRYRTQVSTSNDFMDIIYDQVAKDFVLDKRFQSGQYYLKIRALDTNGIEGESIQKPIVINLLPLAPLIMKPVDSVSQHYVGQSTFSWNEVEYADSYLFELAKDSEFSQIIQSELTKKTQIMVDLDEEGVYFYRVRGLTKDKKQGVVSDIRSLSLIKLPETPTITGLSSEEELLRLSWETATPSVRVDHYQLQLSTRADFQHDVTMYTSHTEEWQSLRPKVLDYYVRIRVMDNAGKQYSAYSIPVKLPMPTSSFEAEHIFNLDLNP